MDKGVARTCARYDYTTLAVAVVVALAVGFVLGVYREPLARSARSLTATIGLATAPFEKAQAAYRQGDLAGAQRLASPLAEEGDARAQSLLGKSISAAAAAPRTTPRRWPGGGAPPSRATPPPSSGSG